ncbi:MAG: DUF3800 domain-containing protein [Patescibacteria group bacterium]
MNVITVGKKLANQLLIRRKDFRKIETSFCFLDETGLLYSERDKFFGIGVIKCRQPEKIYNRIRIIRRKYNYNEEIKWSKLDTKVRFDMAREIFNIFLTEDISFNCIILDKEKLDFKKHFDNNLYKVYSSFSVALMKLIIGAKAKEILIVLADNYFSPRGENIEERIKKFTNDHYQEFVISGVCQIDSRSSDLLQITDLILGAIVYDLKKIDNKISTQFTGVYKRKFLNFLYQKLNIEGSFFVKNGHRTRNYILSGDKLRATVFDCDRSRVSKFTRI